MLFVCTRRHALWPMIRAAHLPSFFHLGFEFGITSGPPSHNSPSARFPTSIIIVSPTPPTRFPRRVRSNANPSCNKAGHLHGRAHERRVVPDDLKLFSHEQVMLLREHGHPLCTVCREPVLLATSMLMVVSHSEPSSSIAMETMCRQFDRS